MEASRLAPEQWLLTGVWPAVLESGRKWASRGHVAACAPCGAGWCVNGDLLLPGRPISNFFGAELQVFSKGNDSPQAGFQERNPLVLHDGLSPCWYLLGPWPFLIHTSPLLVSVPHIGCLLFTGSQRKLWLKTLVMTWRKGLQGKREDLKGPSCTFSTLLTPTAIHKLTQNNPDPGWWLALRSQASHSPKVAEVPHQRRANKLWWENKQNKPQKDRNCQGEYFRSFPLELVSSVH